MSGRLPGAQAVPRQDRTPSRQHASDWRKSVRPRALEHRTRGVRDAQSDRQRPRCESTLSSECLCGAVRYRIDGPYVDAGYCHCRTCQRAHAAPAVPWLTVPAHVFSYVAGRAAVFRSSAEFQREFCRMCGTQLVFRRSLHPTTIDVTIASLRDPERARPEYHIWHASKIGWFETADTLPRHDDAGPDR